MRHIAIAAMICLASGPALAGAKENAAALLEMWQPKKITVENGVLTAILPQARISSTIYLATIASGICFGPLREIDLPGVSQIAILNEHGAQGYVYEKALEDCDRINSLRAGGSIVEGLVMGSTHGY